MTIRRTAAAFALTLLGTVAAGSAQQPEPGAESARPELASTLRAFYFSLAHNDWDALTSYILPAKVVAHHPAPEDIVAASSRPVGPTRAAGPERLPGSPPAGDPLTCSSATSASVDNAAITLHGDWAEVSVTPCGAEAAGTDEFRFIHFEGRWWIVFIDLLRDPPVIQVAR